MKIAGKQVWFLVGTQSLYGPETLRQVEEQSREVAARLDASDDIPVQVVWKPVLTTAEGIRRVILDANAADECVGVIAWMHTFSPAKMWIAGLKVLAKPLLHLHTQANVDLPFATIDQEFMNLNQAAHGDREFGYILTRLGLTRKIVIGHTSEPSVQREIGMWSRAAIGRAELAHLTIAQFGDNMRGVADTDGDKVGMQIAFGTTVDAYGVADVVEYVDAVGDAEVSALLDEYEASYDVAPELRRGGARHESLRDAARQEAGIKRFLDEHGARAWVNCFESLAGLNQLPGFAAQRLMKAGYGFGPEGDWKTPMLVRGAMAMGEGLPGGASLMEEYTYNMRGGKEGVLGSHMLEIAETLTTARPKLEIHELSIVPKPDPVRLVFDADPAEAVIVGLVDLGGTFRLIGNVVDIVAPDEPLPKLPSARAYWRPRPDFHTALRDWLTYGGGHHDMITTALGSQVFKDLAAMLGVELVMTE